MNELPTFMNHLKQLVNEQEGEIERAVVGRGNYEFLGEYNHLEIKEAVWFKMTCDQRMQKVASVNEQLSSTNTSSTAVKLCTPGGVSHWIENSTTSCSRNLRNFLEMLTLFHHTIPNAEWS